MNYEDVFIILLISLLIIFILYSCYRSLVNICSGDESLEYFIYNNPEFNEATDKTVMIIAGTHGNEPAGHYAINNLIKELNNGVKKIIKGRLILVPSVNYCALKVHLRFIPLIGDINRKYPTKVDQHISSKINKQIVNLLNQTDFILDFHEGWGFNRQNSDSIGSTFTPTNTEVSNNLSTLLFVTINQTIAEDFKRFRIITDNDNLVKTNPDMYFKNENIKGSLRYYANLINKDYILVETTGQKSIQPLEVRINQSENIINIILKNFDIIN